MLIFYKVVITVAGFLVFWVFVRWLLHFVERRLKKFEFVQANSQVFQLIRRVLFLALLLAVGTYLLRMIHIPILEKVFHALLIILLAVPVKNFLTIAIGFLQNKIAHRTENKVDDIIFELLSRFAGFIIIATAIIIALDALGVNVMPFIAGAGVAGIAIGFAAKDTLSNLIAGILLIIDRPFEVGDRIEVWTAPSGSSTWGDVIDIGLRATKIKTMVVRHFGESAVDLQLRVWINDARQRMNTISYITDRVKSGFDAQGVEIPYPKRDVYVKTGNLAQ